MLAVKMAKIINSTEELLEIINEGNFQRISIDGKDGVGKSTLAKILKENTGFTIIELDTYLVKNKGEFVNSIRYDKLASDLNNETYIVEGVCLLEVLNKVSGSVDFHIYMRRTRHGIWRDADVCDIEGDPEEVIKREQDELSKFAEFEYIWKGLNEPGEAHELPGLVKEIIRYHAKHEPHKQADVIFEIEDC